MDLAQKGDHQLAAGDVGEQRERVDEIEGLVREILQAGSMDLARMGVGNILQIFARLPDRVARNIHAVDFEKVPAHGPHQAAGAAADFKGAPVAALFRFQAAEFSFQFIDHAGGGGQKLSIALAAPPVGDVVTGIDCRFRDVGIGHGGYLRLE